MRFDRWFLRSAALVILLLPLPAAGVITVPSGQAPTIQAAINLIVNNQVAETVINVSPGTYTESLTIQNTNKSFTLQSTGGFGVTTINAAGGSALRIINATGALTISGFTVQFGVGGPGPDTGGGFTIQDSSPTIANSLFQLNSSSLHGGGGTLLRASPQFQSVVIQGNQAAVFGGGVFIWIGSNPTFTNSTIANNTSGTGNPFGAGGGAALIDATGATFRTSLVFGNSSKFAGGGLYSLHTFAAAGPTTLLVAEDTDIHNNAATRFDNSQPPAFGGGIHIEDNVNAVLTRSKVRNNTAQSGGGLSTFRARFDVTNSFIQNNTATDPLGAGGLGGGIVGASSGQVPVVVMSGSVLRTNTAGHHGGGISIDGDPSALATLSLTGSLVEGNTAAQFGGGIYVSRTAVGLTGSLVLQNTVTQDSNNARGGGLYLITAATTLTNTTVAGNSARLQGGGIFVDAGGSLNIDQSRIHKNSLTGSMFPNVLGGGLFVGSPSVPTGTVQNSDFADNTNFEIAEFAGCSGAPSPILLYFNNRMTPAMGTQVYNSPCIGSLTTTQLNAVNPARASGNSSPILPTFTAFVATPASGASGALSVLSWTVARATSITISPTVGTVNASEVPTGTFDVMPPCTTTYTLTAVGNTSMPTASVSAPSPLVEFGAGVFAYSIGFTGGVYVAAGDVDGDGRAEVITGAGAGGGPHVRVLKVDSAGNFSAFADFFAYSPAFTGGVFVAAGDVNGDGKADIITGTASGGGPHVRVFNGASLPALVELASFFAYSPGFTGGVRVAAGDVNGDGKADIITAAGPGGGPHIRVFSGGAPPTLTELASFFAYAPGFTGGVFVGAADFNGDGKADIITAAGPGGGPHVRVFNAASFPALVDLASFFAYDPGFTGGVFVAGGNVASPAGTEIVTGPSSSGAPDLRVYNVPTMGPVGLIAESLVYPAGFTGGVRVAVGNVDVPATQVEIITGAGPGGGPHVRVFRVPACP